MKRLIPLFLTIVLLLGCMTGTALAENKFHFDKTFNTVFENEELQLVLVREGTCAEEGTLTFKTSNKKVAAVDENGASTISLYLPARTAVVLQEGQIRKMIATNKCGRTSAAKVGGKKMSARQKTRRTDCQKVTADGRKSNESESFQRTDSLIDC